MTDSIGAMISAIIGVFIVGFVAGLIFAVGIHTGVSPDEAGVATFVLKTFCKSMEDIDESGTVKYTCGASMALIVILSIGLAVGSALTHAATVGDWRIGLVIYGAGWLVGLIYMLVNL